MRLTREDMQRRLEAALTAAYVRGVTAPRDLEHVLRVELAQLGLRPRGEPSVRVSVGSRGGARISVEVEAERVPAASRPAPVIDATLARCSRACGQCFGIGCVRCEGRGWMPRRRRAAA